jgi:hypothetical protein
MERRPQRGVAELKCETLKYEKKKIKKIIIRIPKEHE